MVQELKRDCNTGFSNEHYDLVSIMYHSLQSAAACEMYAQDANQSGDRELTEFFQTIKEQSCQQAERAQQLIMKRAK